MEIQARKGAGVQLWQLGTGERRVVPHKGHVKYVRFSRDGRRVYSGGFELRVWPDDLPWDRAGLRAWIDAHTDAVAPTLAVN